MQRAENRARLAQADAERQKAALDKERRYSSTKDQVAPTTGLERLRVRACLPCEGHVSWHGMA